MKSRPFNLCGLLIIVIIAVFGFFYANVIDTQVVGFLHDDGIYAILGKALSEGKGLKLLHIIGQPGEIKYPLIYPAILALVWFINPHFPQNLPALHAITLIFTLAGLAMTYFYLRQCQKFPAYLAMGVVILVASSFYFIFFSTSLMSEGPYLFFSLTTLWVAYHFSQKQAVLCITSVLILVFLSSVTFLTRTTGITLIAAIAVWLLLNRQWKNTLVFSLGVSLSSLIPWLLWLKFNTPILNKINYPMMNVYSNYGLQLMHHYTNGHYLEELQVSLYSLLTHWLQVMVLPFPIILPFSPQLNVTFLLSNILFLYYLLQLVRTLRKSLAQKKLNSSAFSLAGLYVFFYLLVITLWNYQDQMARFLIVLLPLFWMFFFKPLLPFLPEPGQKWLGKNMGIKSSLMALVLFVTLTVIGFGFNGYQFIAHASQNHWVEPGQYPYLWKDYQETFSWINKNLPKDAKLAAASDVVFYLYTNRQTFYTFYSSLYLEKGKVVTRSVPLLMSSLDHYKVHYLVAEPHMVDRIVRFPVNLVAKSLMANFPKRFQRIYTSSHGSLSVYEILVPQ